MVSVLPHIWTAAPPLDQPRLEHVTALGNLTFFRPCLPNLMAGQARRGRSRLVGGCALLLAFALEL